MGDSIAAFALRRLGGFASGSGVTEAGEKRLTSPVPLPSQYWLMVTDTQCLVARLIAIWLVHWHIRNT